MPAAVDRFAGSRFGLSLAVAVGRLTPPSLGRPVARAAAGVLAARAGSDLVRALRANRWVVSGGTLGAEELDSGVAATLRHQSRCLYDLYHLLGASPAALLERVRVGPSMSEWLERNRAGEAVVVAGPHLSAFDLAIITLASLGLDAQAITPPDPTGAYRRENRWRERAGMRVTPASLGALKEAEHRLEHGGAVMTGIDRPLKDAGHKVLFFGRPALLPVLHVRLATHSGASLVVPIVRGLDDGTYEVDAAGPVTLAGGHGRDAEAADAEAVLRVAEDAIRARPEQWQMPHPVWPEAVRELDVLEARLAPGEVGAATAAAEEDGEP